MKTRNTLLSLALILPLTTASQATVIIFNGLSGATNTNVPAGFGSNINGVVVGTTIGNGYTPNIALTWGGGGAPQGPGDGGWDQHGATTWNHLDPSGDTIDVHQMEGPTIASPNFVTFTVDDGFALVLNSVDIGQSTASTQTVKWGVTIKRVSDGFAEFNTTTAEMAKGTKGTININFTGTSGTDYRLEFNDLNIDGITDNTAANNGGAIDNLSFGQVIPGPDGTPPTIASGNPFVPADNSTNMSTSANLTVTFNEAVVFGTGSITIRKSIGDGVVETFDVETATNLLLVGQTVTINPTLNLSAATSYYIRIDPSAIKDTSGNSFAGITDTSTWNFTTEEALRLRITPNGVDFDFSWPSRVGKAYDLLSSTDLATAPAEWAVYDPDETGGFPAYENIPSDGLLTTLTAVPKSGPRRFFVISEKDAPRVVLVEAHRGNSIAAPENTVASIQAAAAASADLTEFDGRVSSDGKLVVMHDATVDRTTNGTGPVSSLTLAQIKLFDAGSWFSPAFTGERVPTMVEAINACIANGLEPLIEQKAGDASVYHAEFVSFGLNPSAFRIISFNQPFLTAMNSLKPAYRLGILGSGTITQAVIDNHKAAGIDFLYWNQSGVNQPAVDLVHANGMELHAYTVNDAPRMQQLIDYGVDGIITDNPALLRSLLP